MSTSQRQVDSDMWFDQTSGEFDVFAQQQARRTSADEVPQATAIQKNIPVYCGDYVRTIAPESDRRRALLAEWTNVFANGAGIIIIKKAMHDLDVIDRATKIFSTLIDQEKAGSGGGGDHFAKAGANDRIWNALEKHCLFDADNFARYYASDAIAMGAEAWLGRGYQMTAQVNRVNPGGAAQKPHRDYHLGFMRPEQTLDFPAHVHAMSPFLTLQGAVAHCDMPLESGPTQLLPFSQHFKEGYLAFGRDQFQQHFADHFVQLPLEKGDVVFFNPAVMHAAGNNVSSDIYRMANLLQVSSAFGRAMESVNRYEMCLALYPVLQQAMRGNSLTELEIRNAVHASAEGYSFPTNLDRDPPVDGLAPKTQAQFVLEALAAGLSQDDLKAQLGDLNARQQS